MSAQDRLISKPASDAYRENYDAIFGKRRAQGGQNAHDAEMKEHIDALVGDRLTAEKADHICQRDGYAVTGVVLTLADGRACIVNLSAVRWLHGARDLWNLLHTDSVDNVQMIAAAVAAEREACAQIVEAPHWKQAVRSELQKRAAAIRMRVVQ